MDGLLEVFWGGGEKLGAVAMATRAVAMFSRMFAMIRLAGRRSFGRKSTFDSVVVIMLGAIAARGVVGASPFASTVAACGAIVALHRLLGRLCVTQRWLSNLESHRLERQREELCKAEDAFMERNGRISFLER